MANFRVNRIRIDKSKLVRVIQTGQGRTFTQRLGGRLVDAIRRFFPRSRQPDPGQPHAADTIKAKVSTIPDGMRIEVGTEGSDHAIFVEKGSGPSRVVATRIGRTRQGRNKRGQFTRRRPVLVIEKESGEIHFRTLSRKPAMRGKEPFRRGAESLGLKVRRR